MHTQVPITNMYTAISAEGFEIHNQEELLFFVATTIHLNIVKLSFMQWLTELALQILWYETDKSSTCLVIFEAFT